MAQRGPVKSSEEKTQIYNPVSAYTYGYIDHSFFPSGHRTKAIALSFSSSLSEESVHRKHANTHTHVIVMYNKYIYIYVYSFYKYGHYRHTC